jgi:hypothetical protein
MYRDRSFFDDTGANAIRAFRVLGPRGSSANPPILESTCLGIFIAMVNCNSRAVTEQDSVSSLPNHLVKLIDLLLGAEDELIQRLATILKLTSCEDAGRVAIDRINAVFIRRSLPRARYLLYPRRRRTSPGNRINVFSVPCD